MKNTLLLLALSLLALALPAPAADPATNAPAPALAPTDAAAASDCARILESAFREIDPGTNGAAASPYVDFACNLQSTVRVFPSVKETLQICFLP